MDSIKSFKGLLKKRNGYHFLNSSDLLKNFIEQFYPEEYIVVLLNCVDAFIKIPKLNILKRDDFTSFLMGLTNEYVIIEFATITLAKDFIYSLPKEFKNLYLLFNKGKIQKEIK